MEWVIGALAMGIIALLALSYARRGAPSDMPADGSTPLVPSGTTALGGVPPVAVFTGFQGRDVALVPASDASPASRPSAARELAPGLASKVASELGRLAPTGTEVAGGDVYRLVGGVRELAQVKGKPDLYRGFARGTKNEFTGHGEFAKVGAGSLSPAIALTVASAALGCYWQQQIDEKLATIDKKVGELLSRSDEERDAALRTALEELQLRARQPIGRSGGVLTPAANDARQVLHAEHRLLRRLKAELDGMLPNGRTVDARELAEWCEERGVFDHLRRYLIAHHIDAQGILLEMTHSDNLGDTSVFQALQQLTDHRRAQLEEVLDLAAGLSYVKLRSPHRIQRAVRRDRTLRERRDRAEASRLQARELGRALGDSLEALPDESWLDGGYELVVMVDEDGTASGYVAAGPPELQTES